MKQKVCIVRHVCTTDADGFRQLRDDIVQSGMADVLPKSETLAVLSGTQYVERTVSCHIRHCRNIVLQAGMTLISDGDRYTITSAVDVGGKKRWWELTAQTEVMPDAETQLFDAERV